MASIKNDGLRVKTKQQTILTKLPGVDTVLEVEPIKQRYGGVERELLSDCIRETLQNLRKEIALKPDEYKDKRRDELMDIVISGTENRLTEYLEPSLKRVVNGTGVILHTGLGRAPLARAVQKHISEVMAAYSNVELDLGTGKRGERQDHVEKLLCFLSGAESAAVVNNNAAAVLLALNSLARGKEVIVSRGQLIEIGGSFRLPEVMEQSGAIIKEVGTTNKTHFRDYEKAINENTGAILVAHSSNYKILGFTAEVSIQELVKLGKRHHIPVIYDLGGGVFLDLKKYGLPYEPVVKENVRRGVDVVTFSGDKVLGGPQSGILVGKKEVMAKIRTNPMMRALRCDKLILSALQATLRLYLEPEKREKELPVFRLLLEEPEIQQMRIESLLQLVKGKISNSVTLTPEDGTSQIGSGALPLAEIPSRVLRIESKKQSAQKVAAHFRTGPVPIVGYLREEGFYLNFRTIFDEELPWIAERLMELE